MDDYNYRDRTGEHRPKIIFAGKMHHTKEHSIKVNNTIGCGCKGDHDPEDARCFYNCLKNYMVEKDRSDRLFMRAHLGKLNEKARRGHTDATGDLLPINFFRAMSRKGPIRCTWHSRVHLHQNMGDNAIREIFECRRERFLYWNQKLDLNPEKRLLAASARRTFCTVGDKYTARREFLI